MPRKTHILFICTHNRCRSILAEAITHKIAADYFIPKSAGSSPAGEVHPHTIKHLKQNGYSTELLKSTSWEDLDEFIPDICVTVCDNAASETCPIWLGNAIKIHWGIKDPSQLITDKTRTKKAFEDTVKLLEKRLAFICAHHLTEMSVTEIGELFQHAGEL